MHVLTTHSSQVCVSTRSNIHTSDHTFAQSFDETVPIVTGSFCTVKIANKGYAKALSDDKHLLAGLNVHKGMVTYKAVADVFGHKFVSPDKAITS